MRTQEADRRLQVARALVPRLPNGVAAMVACGSVADGTADAYSDLDLYWYWRGDRVGPATMAKATGGTVLLQERDPEGRQANELLHVDGLRIEVTHLTFAVVDEVIAALVDEALPLTDDQGTMRMLVEGVVLHGPDAIAARRARLLPYPERLAHAVVEANLRFFPHRWFDVVVRRDQLLYASRLVTLTLESVLGVLLGLNRIYGSPSEAKQFDLLTGRMTIAPDGIRERARALVSGPPAEIAGPLDALVRDVFRLTRTHMPQVDTRRAWQRYDLPGPS